MGFFEFLLSSEKLNKDDLLPTVIDVLFGGVDTTSNTMQCVVHIIAKNPDKQDILRQDVLVRQEVLVFFMGRDEEVFENAEAFKPERWLSKKDFVLTEVAEVYSSITFEFGTPMCLGRRIAELELHRLLPRNVQHF